MTEMIQTIPVKKMTYFKNRKKLLLALLVICTLFLQILNFYAYYHRYINVKGYLSIEDNFVLISGDSNEYKRLIENICSFNPLNTIIYTKRFTQIGYPLSTLPFYCLYKNNISLIIPNILFSLGSIFFMYKIFNTIFNNEIDYFFKISAILWFISSQSMLYFNVVLTEPAIVFSFVLTLYYFLLYQKNKNKDTYYKYLVSSIFYIISRPTNILIFIIFPLYHILKTDRKDYKIFFPIISILILTPAIFNELSSVITLNEPQLNNTSSYSELNLIFFKMYLSKKNYAGNVCDNLLLCFSKNMWDAIKFTIANTVPFRFLIRHLLTYYVIINPELFIVLFLIISIIFCLKMIPRRPINNLKAIILSKPFDLLFYLTVATIIHIPITFHLVRDRYVITNTVTIPLLSFIFLNQITQLKKIK